MSRTILLADDSVTIRKIVEITFGDTDVRVATVASGHEALERLESVRPDVVIADVAMPGPSGYELCERIKRSPRPVPVLLLAGTFEPFDAERARACGADGHLVKPFESRTLLSRVEALLELASQLPSVRVPAPAHDEDVEATLAEAAGLAAGVGAEPPTREERGVPAGEKMETVLPASTPFEPPEPEESVPAAPENLAAATPASAFAEPAPVSPEFLDAVVREVVRRLSEETVREIAWEVVPDLAETIIKERLDEIERRERERR